MYCSNCGNKVDENAYICVNCGVIMKRDKVKASKKNNGSLICGIFGIVFGVFALLLSVKLFFTDISKIGMYNELMERVNYAVDFVLIPFTLSLIALIFSLVPKNKVRLNCTGLYLALISLFLIITEIMVVIIY